MVVVNQGVNFAFKTKKGNETLSVGKSELINTNIKNWGLNLDNDFQINNSILSFRSELSSESELVFDLIHGKETYVLRQGIEELDEYLKFKPEVIYIGKSKNVVKRLRSHSTLLKSTFELLEHEEIMIYFIHFFSGYGGKIFETKLNSNVMDFNISSYDRLVENYKAKYGLLERLLINLFQPKYNSQHMKTDLDKDKLIKKELLENDVEWVAIDMYFGDNIMLDFWSPKKKNISKIVSLNFNKIENGFQKNYTAIKK